MLGRSIKLLLFLVFFQTRFAALAFSQERVILAGTSGIADIAGDLLEGSAAVRVLVPGGACPGHYDLSPGDLLAASNAMAIIIEPWQRSMHNIGGLIRAAEFDESKLHLAAVSGSLMVPENQLTATRAVAGILSEVIPERREQINYRCARRLEEIVTLAGENKKRLSAEIGGRLPVAVHEMQKQFVNWAGFEAVLSFDDRDSASPKRFVDLVTRATVTQVSLVIDNLQSGGRFGAALAEELSMPVVVLSNFPAAEKGQESWKKAFEENVSRLIAASKQSVRSS